MTASAHLPSGLSPGRLCLLLVVPLAALAVVGLQQQGGVLAGIALLFDVPASGIDRMLVHYGWWPRLTVALLAGAGLAFAGVIMQQVLRNPLASPTTLGVASGANLALMAATLTAPGALLIGREWVALAGGGLAAGLVFLLARRRALAPVLLILAGLVVNLNLSAVAVVLLLFNEQTLQGLLLWSAGALAQNNWDNVLFLVPRLALGMALAIALARPLAVLELDDASAKSLGVSLSHLRIGALALAVFITACVAAAVGIIGFIGLAAPNIVRMAGARHFASRLLWSTVLGALLLAIADLALQSLLSMRSSMIPTGAVVGMLAAPLLLWLIPRLRLTEERPPGSVPAGVRRNPAAARPLAWLAGALALGVALALLLGQTDAGWQWAAPWDWWLLQWRAPRLLAAAGSGLMLAVAGTLLQRLSANPMASPEVLGISSGCAVALILAIFFLPQSSSWTLIGVGTAGAFATLLAILALNARSGFAPARLLLTGVALTSIFETVRSLVMVSGSPLLQEIIAWLAGSTYYVDLTTAAIAGGLALLLGLAAAPFARWLDILPLGASTAQALGVRLTLARLALLLLVAMLTATATLLVGPLSFVGLLAPHMARLLGLHRASIHMAGAALVGMLLMVVADWLGRQIAFPDEIPAGIAASLIGGFYFMWQLRRL